MKEIAIIGAGNVGKVLGYALMKKGYRIKGVVCRSEDSARKASRLLECPVYLQPETAAREAEIVFLTTPDRVVEDVCKLIADRGGFRKGQVVLHTVVSIVQRFSLQHEGKARMDFLSTRCKRFPPWRKVSVPFRALFLP